MSNVIYGGFKFPLVKTNRMSQEDVYTEDGMDYLYTKYTLDCQLLVTIESLAVNPSIATGNLDQRIGALRTQILQPRQRFIYGLSDTGAPLLDIGGPDIAGGPFPEAFDIVEVEGANAVIMTFRITAHSSDCPDDDKEFLSNRFEVTSSYNQDFFATRTTTGKLVMKGDRDPQPDEFRNVVMPLLPKSFRRKSMDFKVSSNGLELGYTIVDEEKFFLDRASTTADGTYTEEAVKKGVFVWAQIEITLSAPRNFSKGALVIRAVDIAFSRLEDFDFLESASITEKLFENAISLRVRARKRPNKIVRGPKGLFLFGQKTGGPIADLSRQVIDNLPAKKVAFDGGELLFDDPDFPAEHSADLSIRNEEIIRAAVAAWREPCVSLPSELEFVPWDEEPPEDDLEDPEPDIQFTVIPADESFPEPLYSESHKLITGDGSLMYLDATMEIDYITRENTIQLPIATSKELSELVTADNVFVDLSRPTMVKRVSWSFERLGGHPEVPAAISRYFVPDTSPPAEARLLRKSINPVTPELSADGLSTVYRLSGSYEYGFDRVLKENEKALDAGTLPWDQRSLDNNRIPTANFKTDFTEDGQP